MQVMRKQATVYLDEDLHRVLKLRAAEGAGTISEFVNRAVREALEEEAEELEILAERRREPTIPFEEALRRLRRDGRL